MRMLYLLLLEKVHKGTAIHPFFEWLSKFVEFSTNLDGALTGVGDHERQRITDRNPPRDIYRTSVAKAGSRALLCEERVIMRFPCE
jgi:hypothetical protein